MEKLSEIYSDYVPFFNVFNLKNRPAVDLLNFAGQHGNLIEVVQNYNIAMSGQGFIEEARYFGNSPYHLGFQRVKANGLTYDQVMKIIFSMTETNFENEIKAEQSGKYRSLEEKENDFFDTGANCYGRTNIFYAELNNDDYDLDLEELLMDDGYEILLVKDKVGMTPMDHYLLACKYKEYIYAMQVLSLSATNEEKMSVLGNTIFGFNCHEGITPNSISLKLAFSLAKADGSNNKEIAKEFIAYSLKAFEQYETTLEKEKKYANNPKIAQIYRSIKAAAINTIENIKDFGYMSAFNKDYEIILEKIEDGLLKAFMGKYKEIEELHVLFEKKMLNKTVDTLQIEKVRKIQNRL